MAPTAKCNWKLTTDHKTRTADDMSNTMMESESTVTLFPDMAFFFEESEDELPEVDVIGDWAMKRIATLQVKLEYIERKKAFSRNRFSNILGPVIINLANEVFGFDGWSSQITSFSGSGGNEEDDDSEDQYFSTVRVILKDGTFCDGEGSGPAQKQATTDGLKRAIMGFPQKLLQYENQ